MDELNNLLIWHAVPDAVAHEHQKAVTALIEGLNDDVRQWNDHLLICRQVWCHLEHVIAKRTRHINELVDAPIHHLATRFCDTCQLNLF